MKYFYFALSDFTFWSVAIGFFVALTIVSYTENYSDWFVGLCVLGSVWSIFAAYCNYKRLIKCLKIS